MSQHLRKAVIVLMITIPLDDAAHQLSLLREQLTQGESSTTATLTAEGKPVLAIVPWEFYKVLLDMAQGPTDPRYLLTATVEIRQRALTVAAAKAETVYTTPELLAFEANGDDDLFDTAE